MKFNTKTNEDHTLYQKLYEYCTHNYIQTSHFQLNKFQYDMIRAYADRFETRIQDVLDIQK